MTLTKHKRTKFYTALRMTTNVFDWKIAKGGKIRAIYKGNYYCPLTAIAKLVEGKRYTLNEADRQYVDVGFHLYLSDREDIISAADSVDDYHLRNQILKILKLN